jgi:rubredoxin-NAD+ reductase
MNTTVIVGAGLAGWTVARELRRLSADQVITMVAADAADFYAKPMLSNALAQGKTPAQLVQTPATQMAEQLQVQLLPHTQVMAVDRARQSVRLQSVGGEQELAYAQLILALGADPIRLSMPGIEHVLSVNDLGDYARFRAQLPQGGQVLIIGGGLIGCEFANDLVLGGYPVRVIDPGQWPLGALLSKEKGRAFQAALAQAGVRFHMGDVAESVRAEVPGFQVQLRSGHSVFADVVLSAVGLRPRIALAQAAGLKVQRGIEVDAWGRTNDPHIYAVGDCAAYEGQTMPFVMPLMTAAKAIAASLAGVPTPIVFKPAPVRVKTPAMPIAV